jgi:diguanylate cyclase (GGDEF)-like protein/PAS domain S-box-containing protein
MTNLEQAVDSVARGIELDPREIAERRAFLEIDDADVALLRRLHDLLSPRQAQLSETLISYMSAFAPLQEKLSNSDLAAKLKDAQAIYFDLMTAGDYGLDYVKSRIQVGVVQHRVGVEPKWAIGTYRKYLSELLPVLRQFDFDVVTFERAVDALLKIASFDLTLAFDTAIAEERRDILVIKNFAEQIVANMPSGLMIIDEHMHVRSMNRYMRELFDLPVAEEGIAPPLDAALSDLIRLPELSAAIENVFASNQDVSSLTAALPVKADNRLRHIDFSISASLRRQHNAVLVMAQDVTVASRSQEALRRFRMALDSSIDAVYLIDYAQLRFVDANETASHMLGYSRQELCRMGPQDLKPDQGELRRIQHRFENIVRSESQTGMLRTTHQCKNGSRVPVEVYLRAYQSEGRQLFVAVARDITERLQAEAELRKSEQRFRVAFNQAAVGLAHVSASDGRFLMVNQKLCEIVGYTQEAMLGMRYLDLTHPEDVLVDQDLGRRMYAREIHEASREKRYLHRNGYYIWVNLTSSLVRDENGEPRYYSTVVEDISRRKQMEGELLHIANHDVLTSLPNRTLFLDRLTQAIAYANRSGDKVAILLIDLDRFKNINDSLGHDIGDKLLTSIARKLTAQVRDVDTVARLGGDEFVIMIADVEHEDTVAMLAQQVLEALSQAITIQGHDLYPAGSIGISLYPKDGGDSQTLIKNADTAMYRAKEAGRNNFQFYAYAMNARALDRLKLEGGLRHALLRDEFVLHYQPQMHIATGEIVGVEALLRWQPPGKEMIYPADFIPIAEETGLIVAIGEWALRTACAQHKAWRRAGLAANVRMSVNLSARQFKQQDISKMVLRALQETECDPTCLELEITESIIMENPEIATATLQRLSDMGVFLSIDDFGTGYSSLAYLKRFPIHTLKIDRSFVRDITTDADDAAIAKAVIALAHSMKLNVIAEGVETIEQLDFLREQSCDVMQGYYLSKPLPARQMESMLRGFQPLAIAK